MNIKSEALQKKLKTVRGSYTDLDLSIHAKKGPEKSRATLPLNSQLHINALSVHKLASVILSKLLRNIARV